MAKESGCYKCKDRKVGCHSNCEKYKRYREELDVINNRRRKVKEDERLSRRCKGGKLC